ncbi:MAG: glutaminyl-peptide cyclotransferase [Pirellulaceae bacterium]|nr:glutaminyl-peptide cyclotransferase [Pirellulaceae bacterium]
MAIALAVGIWLLTQTQQPRAYGYRILNTFPHDPTAYTQGLVFRDGFLFEGTGKHGESSLRRVEPESGRVLQSHNLSRELFGEGITIFGDRIYQLSWRNGIAIVYDKESFRELKRLRYEGEGWGLTDDGTHLIMSDGSATLRFVDPEDFQVVRRLVVHSQGRRVDQLNELEYVNGEIYANVWYRDYIARISPRTGEVTGWIDLRGLWPKRRDRDDVLNGIAYDAEKDRLFVTGKNWPKLFEIQVVPR